MASIAAVVGRFERRESVVAVIGLGYVGLPLGLEFVRAGFTTVGFDVDPAKVEQLLAGKSYIKHISSERVAEMVRSGKFVATTDFSKLREVDAVAICVPTPLDEHQQPDLSYVENTTHQIAKYLRPGQLIILESTTYPGTTEELVRPVLEAGGLKVGQDFYLAFSPEREDPGNKHFSTREIPKVVGGTTPDCLAAIEAFYGQVFSRLVPVSSTQVAEMAKLLENIFRCVNIALVNELKVLCDRMGVDIWEVIRASSTKPFGYMPFYPGPGLGGHCIPIDPFYLSWKAREYDFSTRFIELAGEVNNSMPYYVVSRVSWAMSRQRKTLNGAKVLVMGVAYKADIDDCRESPALKVIQLLRGEGAEVNYHDPFVPRYPAGRKGDPQLSSVALTAEAVRSQDVVLIVTGHSQIDYQWLVDEAQLVVDTRNMTQGITRGSEKVVKA